MRIEILANGMGTVHDFRNNLNSLHSSISETIASMQGVENQLCNIKGGIGSIQPALDSISSWKSSVGETRKKAVSQLSIATNSFLDNTIKTDTYVARQITANREIFYNDNSWLRPKEPADKTWWGGVVDGWNGFWKDTSDVLSSAWDGLKDFYKNNKKIIDTIVIGGVALLSAALIIGSGGTALAPLIGLVGISAATAEAISIGVATVAVIAGLAAATVNIIDTWIELNNPEFNTLQSSLNWTAAISGGLYAIGEFYTASKELYARWRAVHTFKKQGSSYANVVDESRYVNKTGGDFYKSKKDVIKANNLSRNHGVLRADTTGEILSKSKKTVRGVSPKVNEANVDHILPKSLGGDNSLSNAQLIPRKVNIQKSNKLNYNVNVFSIPDKINLKFQTVRMPSLEAGKDFVNFASEGE